MNLKTFFESLARRPVVGPVVCALRNGNHNHAKDMSASIAFFSFFSLFPLSLGVIAIGSLFLDAEAIQGRVGEVLAEWLPGSAEFVKSNVQAVVRLRGAAGAIGLLGLAWSASKVFGAVDRGINHALGQSRTHAFFLSPLRYLALMLVVSLLLFLSMGVSVVVDLLGQIEVELLGDRGRRIMTVAGNQLTSWVFLFVVLAALYWLVPYERPSWRAIVPGALLAALLIALCKAGFSLYIDRIAHLQAVYGSVSSIIVLLLWLYVSARVLMFGADLIAVRQEQTLTPASPA